MAEQIGEKFFSTSTTAVEAVFTPAQNVNGAILRTATMQVGAAYGILSTGATAPSGYSAVNVPVLLSVRGTNAPAGSNAGASVSLPFPLTIPAGKGLWVALSQAGDGKAYVTYDLLP
ncbi:MAG TPA: hypothetical protein VF682_19310 [Pseudomonas sp.]